MEELLKFEVEQPENEGPVTCLGITFPNDDERREFFRNELRKKLPELKLLEGFPIGEDEDIIALSDPPYYTACPNPWLNDFIKSWEDEKTQLTKDGKRTDNFEVKEPYASDVSEGKNNPIYMAHAYHTKVPHPAIMRYILHYTQPGDIVFDGFCGTGMTGVAAQLCGSEKEVNALGEPKAKVGLRHCVCSDLSPIASLISAGYNIDFNPIIFKNRALSILDQVEEELGWMYKTTYNGNEAYINYTIWSDVSICPSCGKEINLWKESVNLEKKEILSSFKCPYCGMNCTKRDMEKSWSTLYDSILGKTIHRNKKDLVRVNVSIGKKRYEFDARKIDLDLIDKIESIDLSKYSTLKLKDGFNTAQPIKSNGIEYIHQFYTKRNYIYLNRIYELVKGDVILTTWFTSVLQRTTFMSKFMFNGTGIVNGTLYIPSLNRVYSPYPFLKSKLDAIKKSYYSYRNNTTISVNSATKLFNIRNSSIDYIFTDPPFGANIMYSELSSIWEGWLKVITNDKEEAIINKTQHKNLFDYQSLMNASLKEYYRVLKPGKWLTMEFSNTSASVWNSIQNALQGVGFIVVNVAALDKKQGSFKAVTSPTAVKQDLIITCYKPADELISKFSTQDLPEKNVWDFVEDLLNHLPIHLKKDNSTTAVVERSAKILFDRLVAYYVQHGYAIPMNASEFQSGLKNNFVERDGMYFTAEQAIEYEEKKKKTNTFVRLALSIGSEAEGIEWLKNKLEKCPKTYGELSSDWMQDLVTPRKGDVLPELMQILDENFLKDENGYWHIPDINDQSQKEAMRTKRLLKEFDIYIEAKKIKTARLEALRCGFKECYKNKDFATIISVGNKLPEQLLMEDEILLQYYDIASTRV